MAQRKLENQLKRKRKHITQFCYCLYKKTQIYIYKYNNITMTVSHAQDTLKLHYPGSSQVDYKLQALQSCSVDMLPPRHLLTD